MKKTPLIISTLLIFLFSCQQPKTPTTTQQNFPSEKDIYSFINHDLPNLTIGKSEWGIFFLSHPYRIDSSLVQKIIEERWEKEDYALRDEFYKSCLKLDTAQENNFEWKQGLFTKAIIVPNTKNKIPLSDTSKFSLDTTIQKKASYRIKEWNKSPVDDRLINYSSIPIFSSDHNYVLIVRGQDVRSEGGWDSIYIYKKEENKWTIWKQIIISSI